MARESADVVVIGGGTIGGWASYFAARSGAERVVVLERDRVGRGASSRASGMVRAQGGTPLTVRFGMWTIDFYSTQQREIGTDSGFEQTGYLILAVTRRDERLGQERIGMQREAGLDVGWLDPQAAHETVPVLAREGHRGGSFTTLEGYIDPPRNVLAYTLAARSAGVDLRERTPCTGIVTESGRGERVVAVETPAGTISTERVIVTGGPSLRSLGRMMGARIPVGAARHQVVVTEPHEAFRAAPFPMVFHVGAGIYWRQEDGGLLWGMSNPEEAPGPAKEIDWSYLKKMGRRLNKLVPLTTGLGIRKAWAATIDFTPDHLPIVGPVVGGAEEPIEGTTLACAAGHGMMWGPAVARVAVDVSLEGRSTLVDEHELRDLGMDRFDAEGRSRLSADPVALPFPLTAEEEEDPAA